MKSVFTILISLLLGSSIAVAAEQALIEPLPGLVETALANNPELKSSQARWQMYVAKARQSSSFEDPMLMFKLQNLLVREPFSLGGKDPNTAKVVGISQQLPFWGKRSLREEVASHEAEAYRFRMEERKLERPGFMEILQLYAGTTVWHCGEEPAIMQAHTVAVSRYAVAGGPDRYPQGRPGTVKAAGLQISSSSSAKDGRPVLNTSEPPHGRPVGQWLI